MKKIITLSILLLVTVGGFFTFKVSADGSLPYLIEPILPDNQDEDIKHYISITPDSNSLKQELEFLVTNKTSQQQEINVKLFNAYTSGNGGIQYTTEGTGDNIIIDESYEMNEYLQAPDKVVLEGGESKVLQINVDTPDMDGTILGAVGFDSGGNSNKAESDEVSFEVKNEINTIYGIAVHFPTEQNGNFEIDEPFLDPMPSYYAVRLPITLDAPLLKQNTEISYEVSHEDEKLFDDQIELNFAPYTKTNVELPWEHDEITKSEIYTIKGNLTYGGQSIGFEREFVYNPESTSESEGSVISLPSVDGGFQWVYILVPVLILSIIFLLSRSRNKHKTKYRSDVS